MNPNGTFPDNGTEAGRRWLMGLLTCDMSGHTHPDVKHPFLIIEARTLQQAEDTYNSLVPLTAYYPCHPVASHREDGWALCTDFMNPSEMETIIHELTLGTACTPSLD